MEEPPINQKRKLDIEKAAFSATGIIEQEEWFIKGAEWSDKNPLLISSEKQGKQKPVECCADKLWTEFQKQVAYLMASSYNREYEYTKGYVEWVAQSLLGYAKNEIEQKPAWSEEDEAFLDDILCKVESNLLLNKDEKNWLKSLRPQNTWKPSDEQMDALETAVSSLQSTALESLYNKLKKL